MDKNGVDQDGSELIIPGNFSTPSACYYACIHQADARKITGCEYHISGACISHKSSVSDGSGNHGYTCWPVPGK